MGPRESQGLRSPSPIMAPGSSKMEAKNNNNNNNNNNEKRKVPLR